MVTTNKRYNRKIDTTQTRKRNPNTTLNIVIKSQEKRTKKMEDTKPEERKWQ